MKSLFFVLVLLLVPILAKAESSRANPVQELKKAVVGDCVSRGLRLGNNHKALNSFCNCMWKVVSQNMTVAEFIEIDSANSKGSELPQFKRIQPKLQECKNNENTP